MSTTASTTQRLLARNLKAIRKEKGFSQGQVSERSGVITSTYSRIETCNVNPNLSTLEKLAEAMEVSMSEFFKEDETGDKSIAQKLEMINGMSEYNQNVVGILLDSIIEKDKLERSLDVKMKKRLAELEKNRRIT